jgi:hypothetical protein
VSEQTLPLYLKGVKNQNLLNKEQLVEKIISYTINKFKDYIKKYKQKPKIVILENIGIFYLGKSYDNAINIKNNFEDMTAIEVRKSVIMGGNYIGII